MELGCWSFFGIWNLGFGASADRFTESVRGSQRSGGVLADIATPIDARSMENAQPGQLPLLVITNLAKRTVASIPNRFPIRRPVKRDVFGALFFLLKLFNGFPQLHNLQNLLVPSLDQLEHHRLQIYERLQPLRLAARLYCVGSRL